MKETSSTSEILVSREAKQHAVKVVQLLKETYAHAECSLNYESPLQLLIATILSAQCTDERVNKVTPGLFSQWPTAELLAESPIEEIEEAVQSTGFFRNKAKNIKACCEMLVRLYNSEVPKKLQQLVELPGVGRKTANVVLGTAYGIASGVVVDTHVGRITRRLGMVRSKNPEIAERELIAQLPKKEWVSFSHRLILHGRAVCTARKAHCDRCVLQEICPRVGVENREMIAPGA